MDRYAPPELSSRLGYAGNRLDRLSEKRGNAEWLASLFERRDTRFMLFADDKAILATEGAHMTAVHPMSAADALGMNRSTMILLGFDGADETIPWMAAEVVADVEAIAASGAYEIVDVRSVAMRGAVPPHELGAIAQSRALLNWHGSHGFCSRCGAKSIMASAGYRRDCPACGAQHFPRTDPVAIMLVTDGERCLLGRQPRFPAGMYSCLAGFIEPGETIEDAVRREIREEAGIRVGPVTYLASQPWPFPASLMIGCRGEALTTDIVREEEELEDCRWFSLDEARAMLAGTHPDGLLAPNPIAIAHHLLKAFVEEG